MVEKMAKETQGKTHNHYTLELKELFKVEKEEKNSKFQKKFGGDKNRMLLWHGSRLTNWCGILSQVLFQCVCGSWRLSVLERF